MRDQRFQELDALIAAGWGEVPSRKIPANWQEIDFDGTKVLVDELMAEMLRMPKRRRRRTMDPDAQAALANEKARAESGINRRILGSRRYQEKRLWQRTPRQQRIREREAALRARITTGSVGRPKKRLRTATEERRVA